MVSIQGTGEPSFGLAAHLRAPRPRGSGHETRLRLVTSAQRTPCPELTVHDLVTHQIRGMRIYLAATTQRAHISRSGRGRDSAKPCRREYGFGDRYDLARCRRFRSSLCVSRLVAGSGSRVGQGGGR